MVNFPSRDEECSIPQDLNEGGGDYQVGGEIGEPGKIWGRNFFARERSGVVP